MKLFDDIIQSVCFILEFVEINASCVKDKSFW